MFVYLYYTTFLSENQEKNKTKTKQMKINLESALYEPLEVTHWGFNHYSEKINGRLAMMGFVLIFLIEVLTKEKILDFFDF